MNRVVGSCSLCAGAVVLPQIWGGTVPPIPVCADCGAKAARPAYPVIHTVQPSSPMSILARALAQPGQPS